MIDEITTRPQSPSSAAEIGRRILRRANIMSRMLGITDEDHIDPVLDRYWFVSPLDRLDAAARIIEDETGCQGGPVERVNITKKPESEPDLELERRFRDRSALDVALYARACARFERFLAANAPADTGADEVLPAVGPPHTGARG